MPEKESLQGGDDVTAVHGRWGGCEEMLKYVYPMSIGIGHSMM